MDKKKEILIILFLSILLFQSLTFVSVSVQGSEQSSGVTLVPRKVWYLVGQTLHVDIKAVASKSYSIQIILPNGNLYNTYPFLTDSNGYYDFSLSIPLLAPIGKYTITCGGTATWITIVDTKGLVEVPYPTSKDWRGLTYTIKPLEITVTNNHNELSFDFPWFKSLSPQVTVYQNGQIVKVSAIGSNWKADLNYLFIHNGVKIILNGTVPVDVFFTWKISTVKNFLYELDSMMAGDIVFDWKDIRSSGISVSIDKQANTLQFTILKGNFWIDPQIFSSGFESGDFSEWTGTATSSGSAEIISTGAHHGTYRANFTITNTGSGFYAYAYQTITSTSEIYLRAYIMYDTLPGSGNTGTFTYQIRGTAGISVIGIWTNATGTYWHLNVLESGSDVDYYWAGTPPVIDTWYSVELYTKVHATVGAYTLWIDGVEAIAVTGKDTNDNGNIQTLRIGEILSSQFFTYSVFVDDVIFSSLPIGVETSPTIGGFEAPSTIYANQNFYLNATVNDVNGIEEIINATISFNSSVVLKWDNATSTFSIQTDTNGYVTLTAASSIEVELNATAFKLSWYLKLNNFPSGSVNILAANTLAYDSTGSGAGSTTGLFTFSYITLTLQAQDSAGTNLPKQIDLKGTLGNGTSLDVTSDTNGNYVISGTCYGSYTINSWWGTHLINSTLINITSDQTLNIVSYVKRLNSGANYILMNLNNTALLTPEIVGTYNWRIDSQPPTSSVEFKLDNANWIKTSEPYSFTIGTESWSSGTAGWSFASNIFTFTITLDSAKTISMSWDQPTTGGGGSGGAGEGGLTLLPETTPPAEISPPITTIIPITYSEELMTWGIYGIIGVLGFVVLYGEATRKKPTPRNLFREPVLFGGKNTRWTEPSLRLPSSKKWKEPNLLLPKNLRWSEPQRRMKKVYWKDKPEMD